MIRVSILMLKYRENQTSKYVLYINFEKALFRFVVIEAFFFCFFLQDPDRPGRNGQHRGMPLCSDTHD